MKPSIQYLSDDEIKTLHGTSLRLLKEIGMKMPHDDTLALLKKAGAEMEDGAVVKIPEKMVEAALETLPKRDDVVLYGRDPACDIRFDTHDPSLACMTMAVNVIDPETRRKRPATNEDLALLTRIADQLEHIGVNGGLVTPQEVPGAFNDWYTWATTLKNTSKHITGGMFGAKCVQDAAKMASIAVGSETLFRERPFISGWVLTLPPFGVASDTLDSMMEMNRWNIPIILSSGPILGTSSPVTIAGTVAQAHAEILACIVVSQLVNPGAPVVYTSFARGIDMMTGNISMACPEFGILKVAMAQMGRFLDLPVRMPSLLRDAKVLDAQAGFETGMIGSVGGLSSDLLDAMQLDMDMVVDYPDLIFCNECMAGIKRLARDVVVDEKSIAMDVMKSVGPGGNYLSQPHTLSNFKKELWRPALLERRNWETWEKSGAKDIFKKSEEKTLEMISSISREKEGLLKEDAASAIDRVVEEAQK